MLDGCYQFECMKKGRKAVWEKSFSTSSCCSYQRTPFETGATIRSVVAEDGCTKVELVCVNKNGVADIEITVESDCAKAATEESMVKQFDTVKDVMDQILQKTGGRSSHLQSNISFIYRPMLL